MEWRTSWVLEGHHLAENNATQTELETSNHMTVWPHDDDDDKDEDDGDEWSQNATFVVLVDFEIDALLMHAWVRFPIN